MAERSSRLSTSIVESDAVSHATFSAEEAGFLQQLRALGVVVKPRDLQEKLGWPQEKFDEIKKHLKDRGKIKLHAGRGGGISLAEDQLAVDGDQLMAELTKRKGKASNSDLQEALGWDGAWYYQVRNFLIAEGKIQKWRGRGGTIRLVDQKDKAAPNSDAAEEYERESHLYKGFKSIIEEDWARDQGLRGGLVLVDIVANQGSKRTGGRWTRPDIVFVSLNTYEFIPGNHVEIVTFEVKLLDALDVTAVYEALGHRRSANRSYVVAFGTAKEIEQLETLLEIVATEAKRHGIGLIIATSAKDFDGWEEYVEPSRVEVGAARANEFINAQLSEESKREILRWRAHRAQ